MLYTETDRSQATAERAKRLWVVLVPTVLILLAAIATFVWYRLNRDASGWVLTGLITVVGGAYFIFFYDVYFKPVSIYKHHVDYMLDAHKRETVGLLKEIVDSGLTVAIGSETGVEPLAQCSVVVAPYRSDSGATGAIAVLGPTRMDYPGTMANVAAVATYIGEVLGHRTG